MFLNQGSSISAPQTFFVREVFWQGAVLCAVGAELPSHQPPLESGRPTVSPDIARWSLRGKIALLNNYHPKYRWGQSGEHGWGRQDTWVLIPARVSVV